jgi:hypothetical protein
LTGVARLTTRRQGVGPSVPANPPGRRPRLARARAVPRRPAPPSARETPILVLPG